MVDNLFMHQCVKESSKQHSAVRVHLWLTPGFSRVCALVCVCASVCPVPTPVGVLRASSRAHVGQVTVTELTEEQASLLQVDPQASSGEELCPGLPVQLLLQPHSQGLVALMGVWRSGGGGGRVLKKNSEHSELY